MIRNLVNNRYKRKGLTVKRSFGFLSEEHIDHSGEIFDYIRELHLFLRELCDTVPSYGGDLGERAESALRKLQRIKRSKQ